MNVVRVVEVKDDTAEIEKRRQRDCPLTVERVDLSPGGEIVAICARGNKRQQVPILDLPLPSIAPEGAEWIEAYRHWIEGG